MDYALIEKYSNISNQISLLNPPMKYTINVGQMEKKLRQT